MTRARTLADLISDGVIGTTELADDAITPVKLDASGSYAMGGLDVTATITSDGLSISGGDQILLDTGDISTYGELEVAHLTNGAWIGVYDGSNSSSNRLRFATSGSMQMVINEDGQVGIGANNPTSYGNSQKALVVEDSGNPALCLSDTGQTRDWWLVALGDGLAVRYADGGGSSSATNVSENMFFKNDGKIGIGVSSPEHMLHLKGDNPTGDGASIQLEVNNNNSTDRTGIIRSGNNASNTTTAISFETVGGNENGEMRFYTRDGSTTQVRTVIDSDGRLKITKDAAPTLRIENTDASITTDQVIGDIDFYQSDPSGAGVGVVGRIRSINSDSSYQGQGSLSFQTGTSSSLSERLKISSTGSAFFKRGSDAGNIIVVTGADTTTETLEVGITGGNVQFTATHASGGSNTCGMTFRTRGGGSTAERVRIQPSGGISFNGDTSTSNALDDYEEGTWTPDIKLVSPSSTSSTYSHRTGHYTKIGNLCTVSCVIYNTGHTSSGTAYIHGLPFAHASGSESVGSCQMNVHSDNHSTDIGSINSIIQSNESVIHMRATYNTNASGPLYIQLQNFTYLRITITYRTA